MSIIVASVNENYCAALILEVLRLTWDSAPPSASSNRSDNWMTCTLKSARSRSICVKEITCHEQSDYYLFNSNFYLEAIDFIQRINKVEIRMHIIYDTTHESMPHWEMKMVFFIRTCGVYASLFLLHQRIYARKVTNCLSTQQWQYG